MEEAAAYAAYADRWQWTPDQVDNLPAYLADRMLAAGLIADEVKADKQQAQAKG